MANTEIKDKIEKLRNSIKHHEYMYYVESNPEISDHEFDILMHELEDLETQYPELISPDSPTQRVGGAITSFESITHRIPMMSIENSYSAADITDWLIRCESLVGKKPFPVVAELKIDGVSGSFHYDNGVLISGATRGDGKIGDLITGNIRTIRSLPLSINSKFDMDIRGEIYTPRSVLKKLNEEREQNGLELFKNCRNLTSGTIKSLDPAIAAKRNLGIMVYGIAQAIDLGFKRHSEVMNYLASQGFKLNQEWRICNTMQEVLDFIEEMRIKKEKFDFDTDGIVIKIDDLSLQRELGSTAKAPRWVAAYKYPQERAITKLKAIEWQIGRSQLTPVAHLEPVELGGTTVSKASLHNIDQIRNKDIRIGDMVAVEKAGYIIPYIVESLPEKRNGSEQIINPPTTCPVCGSPISISDNSEDGSTQLACVNSQCKGVIARKIIHFITQLEIENIGPQLVEKLLNNGYISCIEDLLYLNPEKLASIERMGTKSATKITDNISKASTKPLFRLISSLGISNVGIVLSESISKSFNQSFDSFLNAKHSELIEIEGIQETVAKNILDFINNPDNLHLIETLKNWWKGPTKEELAAQKSGNAFEGKIFVITGEATVPRKKLEELVSSQGGSVKSSVSAKTSYVVIGSQEPEDYKSTKKTKALQLNIPIINEFELIKMTETNNEN